MIRILDMLLQVIYVVIQCRAFAAFIKWFYTFRMLAFHVPAQIGRIREILAAIGNAAAIGTLLMRLPMPVENCLGLERPIADVTERCIRFSIMRLHVHA